MANSVLTAKLTPDKNFCTIEDVEVVYKGIEDIYTVTDSGEAGSLKETYGDESEFKYYYCNSCGQDWAETLVQDQKQCWKLVKEHFNG